MTGGTWLQDRNREKAREAAEDARLARVLEAQDETDFIVRFGAAFREAGHCLVERGGAERDRIEVIIQRDRTDRLIEMDRQVAEVEVANGNYYNLVGSALPPTPEWLAKHETMPFTPKQADDTVRVIKTVRVVRTPIIARLWRAGKITDELARACLWYRKTFEYAGLEGRWSSSQWRGPDHISGGGGNGAVAGHVPMTLSEAEARNEYRQAVIAIDPIYRQFFDQVVIHDVSLRDAARFAKCTNGKELPRFLVAAEDLLDHLEARGIELPSLAELVRG